MQKEILNKDKIKEDYFYQFKGEFLKSLSAIIFGLLFFGIMTYLIINFIHKIPIFYTIPFICIFIIFAFIYLILTAGIFDEIKTGIMMKNNKFHITTDKLVYKKVTESTYARKGGTPYILEFARYGDFFLAHRKYYKFSELSDSSLYHSSQIYDIFYLIMCGKKIILVYNIKFFDLDSGNPPC